MAQRDNDSYGQEQRFPVRARRMERPVRGGSYDAKLERMEARRQGPVRPPRGYQRSDDRIREDVCEQLMEGPVDVGDVEVTVSNGEVTLSGTVEERWEKRAIEDIAAHVRGVHDVHNRVRVRPAEDRQAAQETERLRDEQPREQPGEQPHMGG